MKRRGVSPRALSLGVLMAAGIFAHPLNAGAQVLVDPNLGVSTVVDGLNQPIALAFIGPNDLLVTEKESGKRGVARPAWETLLALPQAGDTLKFWKSDRWGRSAGRVPPP